MRVLLSFLLVFAAAAAASGQETAPTRPPEPKPTLRERLKEPDQAGGLHFTEHWAVAFGGIKSGSGIGAGPAFSTKFANGGFMQLKAVVSIRNFQLVQARYDTPRFWRDGAILISRVRWHHAPAVKLYQLGPDSPDRRIDYDERRTEIGTRLNVTLRPHVLASGGFGVERYRTSADDLPQLADPESLALAAPPPGLGAHPFFAHAVASLAFDSRLSPDYTRRGEFFEAVIHSYSDLDGKEDAFGRFEGTAEQYIPTFGGSGVIGLGAQTWLSLSEGARSVPFYLTPTLGGGDLLRAYSTYRFRDRHALLLTAQYRHAVHKFVDVAGTYEAGKVAPVVEDLNFDNMAQSIAIGLRVHTKKAGLLRTDVAYGRDGVVFSVGFSAGGS